MGDVLFCMKLLMVSMDEMATMQRHVISAAAYTTGTRITTASELAYDPGMPAVLSGTQVAFNGSILAGTSSGSYSAPQSILFVNSVPGEAATQTDIPGTNTQILALSGVESKGCQTDFEWPGPAYRKADTCNLAGKDSSVAGSTENQSIDELRGEVSLLHAKLDAVLAALAGPAAPVLNTSS